MAAIALTTLFAIARQLWPDRPDAAVVSVILLASSAQFLIAAMTPYAMNAHLCLNLVWLWLFLRDRWWGHLAAVPVAFVASGLHQVAFHPLFAAPFVFSLLLTGRRSLAVYYGGVYASIILFWIFYWSLLIGRARPRRTAQRPTSVCCPSCSASERSAILRRRAWP